MISDWSKVDKVLEAALECEPALRAEFLQQACCGDEGVRREVESLLAAHEQAGTFIESPPAEMAIEMLTGDGIGLTAGQRIGPYRIVAKLGAGGMGEVYQAEDTRLNRTLALKILPRDLACDPDRTRRFIQEAKAASSITHPNVCTIHDVGESEDHRPFIAMEYIDGQTLGAIIGDHPLESDEIIRISIQAAGALDEAHSRGITHRDIKPANIMITARGQVKVLDFGLAKVATSGDLSGTGHDPGAAKTESGVLLGTVRYMSPEQALGRDVDHRTDIFSLGIVMYETATGKPPFIGGSSGETLDRIIHYQPEAIARFNYDLPAELERIIRKCLEKDRDRRYQSARDLLVDLRNLERDSDSGVAMAPRRAFRLRRIIAASGPVMLAIAVVAYAMLFRSRSNSRVPEITSLAVLPLKSLSGDTEDDYLGLGITDSIITRVSRIGELTIRPTNAVRKYSAPETDTLEAGKQLNVDSVLDGTVQRSGDRVRVNLRLLRVQDGRTLWSDSFNMGIADVFALQDDVSKRVAVGLRLQMSAAEEARLFKPSTESGEAYQFYLKGRYHFEKWTDDGTKVARDYFRQAIDRDPNYALAYAAMADTFVFGSVGLPPNEALPKAREAATRALDLDDSLGEPHAALAQVKFLVDWDWPGADREFKRSIELNPGYTEGRHMYSHYLMAMGRFDESLVESTRFLELDPFSPAPNLHLGNHYLITRQYNLCIPQELKTIQMDPNYAEAHHQLGDAYWRQGRYAEAIGEYEKRMALLGLGQYVLAAYREAYNTSGWKGYVQKRLDRNLALSKQVYVSPYDIAGFYALLGNKDQAITWLAKAYRERDTQLISSGIKVDPDFDELRSDSRFQDLLRRIGLGG
jgi:serine/threonine protein kinase/tetratricopeptide (TPR) repeat protein